MNGVARNPRLGALLVMAVWLAALAAPCSEVAFATRNLRPNFVAANGFRLAELGWLGPLGFSIAWYANLPLAWCIVKELRGRPPALRTPKVALGLALTVLLPHAMYSEVHGWYMAWFAGLAVWLWLAAFVVNAALAYNSSQ